MTDTLEAVRGVVIQALDLPHSAADLDAGTPLLGAMPELDSMGVVVLVAALEQRFDITVEDDEFDADLFETLGSLTRYVDGKLAGS